MRMIVLLAALAWAGAWAGAQDGQIHPSALARGAAAPAFIAQDTLGVSHALADWRGQWVVVDFWASWCGDCRREFPEIKAIAADYGERVAFVSVSMDHDAAAWRKCLRQQQFGWPQLSNLQRWKENEIALAYDLHWIPSYFLIDGDGNVWGSYTDAAALRAALEGALAK